MFEFIIGKIVSIKNDFVVIQNNGIGYRVITSTNSMSKLELGGDNQILYTQLSVREDGMSLYGFVSEDEMDMFNLLLLVSKIGPKIAVGILSAMTPNQLKKAILNRNVEELCKCPGIGKKTAERIIIELIDRVEKLGISTDDEVFQQRSDNEYSEGLEALMSLGYNRYEVENILKLMDIKNMKVEDIIKEGLKRLSRH